MHLGLVHEREAQLTLDLARVATRRVPRVARVQPLARLAERRQRASEVPRARQGVGFGDPRLHNLKGLTLKIVFSKTHNSQTTILT